MRAGLLRNSITILTAGTTKDAFGQLVPGDAVPVLTAQASIEALSGREVSAIGAGFQGQVSHRIVIRYPAVTIRSGMTIAFGARSFLVQYPMDPTERRRELHLICLENSA